MFSNSSICTMTKPRISYVFEKNSDFRGKKTDFREKNRDFVFPGMFHNKTIFFIIGDAHGAIVSSSP